MKILAILLTLAGLLITVSPASADDTRIANLIAATQGDYEAVHAGFQEAHRDGGLWKSKRSLGDLARRIEARRTALSKLGRIGTKTLPPGQRGLFRLVIGSLDQINLSLLALITDGRGYSGYIKTGNQALIKGITAWQEGIRLALIDTRRCLAMARTATGPIIMDARLMPLNTRAD